MTAGLRASSEQIIEGSLDSAKSVSGDSTCSSGVSMGTFVLVVLVLVKQVQRVRSTAPRASAATVPVPQVSVLVLLY